MRSSILKVAALLAMLPACTSERRSTAARRHEFPTFSISVPTTWTRTDYGSGSAHKGVYGYIGPGVRFEGPDGEYIDIAPDLATDINSADTWFNGNVGADGTVAVVGDNTLCEAQLQPTDVAEDEMPGPGCTRGDGRLDAWLFFEGRRHGYVITMGNGKRERAEDLVAIRKVVETMKLK